MSVPGNLQRSLTNYLKSITRNWGLQLNWDTKQPFEHCNCIWSFFLFWLKTTVIIFLPEIISLLCRPWNIHVRFTKWNALHFVRRGSTTLLKPIWKVQPQIMANVRPTSSSSKRLLIRVYYFKLHTGWESILQQTGQDDRRTRNNLNKFVIFGRSFMNNSCPVIFALLHYSVLTSSLAAI